MTPGSLDRDTPPGSVGAQGSDEQALRAGTPVLSDLTPAARGRVVHFIVTSALGGGVAPVAVAALYADLAGDADAVRYADQRFTLRQVPADWRAVEDHVLELEDVARRRGVDLATAWSRAMDVAMRAEDPLEQLARLAGAPASGRGAGTHAQPRSIFDDPEDLDALEDESDEARYPVLEDRPPDLVDLDFESQERLRKFAIEERLERGLPPIELLELYRSLEVVGNDRARQYLDRVFVEREPVRDWLDLQAEAGRVVDLAEIRGRDAGKVYADVLRAAPGIEALVALRLTAERLQMS